MMEIRSIESATNELPHGERPLDANLQTELGKTLACFDRFPGGTTSYDLTIPVYGDRPTFSAKEYADGEVGGTLTLCKTGDDQKTLSVGVMVHDPSKPLGLPVTKYGDTLVIPTELQALKFGALFISFRNNEPLAVVGTTPDGVSGAIPDIGYSVFPGERLSDNHYFYYVMRFILGKVSKVKSGLHISPDGTISRLPAMTEQTQ